MTMPQTVTKWYARRWVQIGAALVLGLIVGAAPASSTSSTLSSVQKDLAKAVQERDAAQIQASTAQTDATRTLANREAAITAREKAVGGAEAAAKANTFAGDGVYLVGTDIQPGTYKSAGGDGCYWSRNSKSGDILGNDLGDGPTVVVVNASDFSLSVRDCAEFRKFS